LNWILVAALEDYHVEMPDGSKNKKANTVYFNRCAKLLQVHDVFQALLRSRSTQGLAFSSSYVR